MPSQVKRVGLEGSKPWVVSASATGVDARSAPTYTGRGNCKELRCQYNCTSGDKSSVDEAGSFKLSAALCDI